MYGNTGGMIKYIAGFHVAELVGYFASPVIGPYDTIGERVAGFIYQQDAVHGGAEADKHRCAIMKCFCNGTDAVDNRLKYFVGVLFAVAGKRMYDRIGDLFLGNDVSGI